MSDEAEDVQAEHQFLIEDIEKAAQRAQKAKFLEAAKEFANEAYPLMHAMADHFGERLTRLEGVVDALIDGSDSMLQPDLAAQILATLEAGKKVATMVMELQPGTINEEAVKAMHEYASAFLGACELTADSVEELTVTEDDDEEDDDEEGEVK